MLKRILFLSIYSYCFVAFAQQNDTLSFKNGIDKPSILATHHFGIFSSRIDQNFKIKPPGRATLTFTYASGNTFHPFVEAYIPKDPLVQEQQSQLIWYHRNFRFVDQETTPADYMNIIIDAIIKEFRFQVNVPLSKQHELDISLRSSLITKGKYPFSLFTSDEAIEWFHSNIRGGEDPYGRRYYGLNQVHFKYTDRNGKLLELHNNDFFISGIEFSHFYYPPFLTNESKSLFFNIGTHLGVNTTKYNPSIDFGISANTAKKYTFKNKNELYIGLGSSVLRKNIINFDDPVDLGNNQYLASFEGEIEFTKYTKKKNYHALGFNYNLQTSYNKRKEANYYQLVGKWKEINGGWQNGIEKLYKNLSYWTFIYTYARPKFKISLYTKEDLLVNNAPDFQTGIGITLPIKK